jgi:hypothetical protein
MDEILQLEEPDLEIEDFEAITTRFRAKQQLYVDSEGTFATTPPDKDDLLKEELNQALFRTNSSRISFCLPEMRKVTQD